MALVKSETKASGNQQQHSSRFTSSLYVGDLSPDVTEQDLIHKFSLTVPVSSVHLCRNSVTGKSLCYAYINFDSPSTASNAMACLNHTDLKGKAMRIMWSRRDLQYRRTTGLGNLYVKNLDSSITSICLERMFSPYGDVLSCKVAEENGKSKGFGFVQFHTEQSAATARSALHGSVVDGKKLFVAKFINKNERAAMAGHQESTNVYVKNLIETVTEDYLHTLFSPYGTISSVVVMRDGMGRSRGFGFVNFCNPVNDKKAVKSLHGQPLGSKTLFVGMALRSDERKEMLKQKYKGNFIAKSNMGWSNLYVKNLSESMNETRLREIFGSYGKIVSAKVMRHENGRSKGFGFVCFSNCEASKQAKRELNGFKVDGKRFVVRVAERKEDRLKRLQQYFHGQPQHYTQVPTVPQPVLPSVPSSFHGQPHHYTQVPPVPSPAQAVFPSVPSCLYGQPCHYTQVPPVTSPAQPVLPSVPSSFHGQPHHYTQVPPVPYGASYYYMAPQLPQMFSHQNITTYVPAGQAPLKEKRSVHLVYKHPAYPFAKSGAKQKLVFKGEGNRTLEAATCSKATTSAENRREASPALKVMSSPKVKKAEKSGKQIALIGGGCLNIGPAAVA
ncbi:PREDICTED: polyadenylate-binding protein 6-like [Camelina sativa]|uniref:Polyadenylate-binding protein 6-like n=1 Tax=Camelina sativa TaxID=90675 RepID=A0ABM0W4R2_CAMSA|nr:PREDICTED: polyadenylate-binding protein 6-like [Camelina sativa]